MRDPIGVILVGSGAETHVAQYLVCSEDLDIDQRMKIQTRGAIF
jgi:hypothetical protein